MQHVGYNVGAAWGAAGLTKKSVQAFLARLLEVSEARSFAILDVFQGFEENVLAWADRTRDQRAACACAGGAHACMSRGRGACRGRVNTSDVVLHRSRKSHHLSHDRVIATNDWSSVSNVEQPEL
jgi:hypothetical protein